eukprot:CAMPEP_0115305320 /NCGR_PEP_ID=MMETSP0270-20121206/71960_1 /TAXON_ID=71861 /ORGANISM="Scrippsiella trochoidea, Strain CCMP3099" /LENGTH=230 /DNA_ID=CAMNT_0002723519 /DNA_START=45 /DNA_END=737 /DNA_ORIENTATION=+
MGAESSAQADPLADYEEVTSTDPAWKEVDDLLQARSRGYTSHYKCHLKLTRLVKVSQSEQLRQNESRAKVLGEATQLFHGTSIGNALKICRSGFQLPRKAGMFGRGVYFADCPLKSANFAPDSATASFQYFREYGLEGLWKKTRGQMLLCDVYLGRSKTMRKACSELDPSNDLKPSSWFEKIACALSGSEEYDSVYVPGGWFGAVRVTEYVVYKEHQGIPRYLIEFQYCR